ncbi:MAG: DivIVA domain-containing protein [Candidatus Methylomirabilia bacterium]
MRISPPDIRQQQFSVKLFRGFDMDEVDTFLNEVAEDYEHLLRENSLLKEQLAASEERARGYKDLERTIKETLLTSQRLAEELKETARREAEELRESSGRAAEELRDSARKEAQFLLRDAELQGEKLMEEARAEAAKIQNDILMLKRTRRQLAEGLRSTVDMYQTLIAQELADEGPGAS